jgi:hypothetical protein
VDQPITLTRSQRILFAAQEAVQEAADEIFWKVSNMLRSHSCVAFAITCGENSDWSPLLGTAVNMLSIALNLSSVDDGHMIWGLHPNWATPEAIERGASAVAECVSLLKNCPVPYTFLAHAHGQPSIEVHFRCDRGQSPWTALAEELGAEVAWLPNV